MMSAALSEKISACAAVLPVYALSPFTMLDFPGKTACIVWFSGCNMRCAYCHNPQIVKGKGRFALESVFDFLGTRRGLLDGVVLSGGEATLYPGIVDFARRVKEMGFSVKLDTNGTRPDIIERLLSDGLVDYIALDYKAPDDKFREVTRCGDGAAFVETLSLLTAQAHVPFEVRTTAHADVIDEADINAIIADLESRGYHGAYYVQNFIGGAARPTLGALREHGAALDPGKIAASDLFSVQFRNF